MVIQQVDVLTTRVLPIGADEAGSVVASWAADGIGRVVCAANVHMVMEAWDDAGFADTLRQADLTVCDGRPLVWACRLAGVPDARHTRGLDLLHATCEQAAKRRLVVGLYGAEAATNAAVREKLTALYPGLDVRYAWSPPFRELTAEEDQAVVQAIAEAGVQVLFVGLGCPKQERWMIAHRDRVDCVSLGVGAAFDMLAGTLRVAPGWMQTAGLEWVFRLALEPRRLWRRYASHNGRFVLLVARQLMRRQAG